MPWIQIREDLNFLRGLVFGFFLIFVVLMIIIQLQFKGFEDAVNDNSASISMTDKVVVANLKVKDSQTKDLQVKDPRIPKLSDRIDKLEEILHTEFRITLTPETLDHNHTGIYGPVRR